MEYYYIDFKDCEIYSYTDENTEIDKANKLTGNSFVSYYQAKAFLLELLYKQKTS